MAVASWDQAIENNNRDERESGDDTLDLQYVDLPQKLVRLPAQQSPLGANVRTQR